MKKLLPLFAIVAIAFNAAIFGFFYAWICSTMWGLDAADPKVAIAAMQAMNASVRNAVFAPAFFVTPFALLLVGLVAWRAKYSDVALLFAGAGILYLCGGLFLTAAVNVPMNNALALIDIPTSRSEAAEIWNEYSDQWQFWNITRTVVSGASLLLACIGLFRLGKHSALARF
ncbi:MAG: DUF1772 domain-containing protein [Rhizobiaceae bacterium]|nr:DUF1772 domain-containing protein [Rhizobiaceae bacterium]